MNFSWSTGINSANKAWDSTELNNLSEVDVSPTELPMAGARTKGLKEFITEH